MLFITAYMLFVLKNLQSLINLKAYPNLKILQLLKNAMFPRFSTIFEQLESKQGQGNQCRTPGVKFKELTGRKQEETGKKRKNRKKKQTMV